MISKRAVDTQKTQIADHLKRRIGIVSGSSSAKRPHLRLATTIAADPTPSKTRIEGSGMM